MNRMPAEMSGGQRQRVAIARAIVRNPRVFLMDEPLANLDAELRVHMRTQLQRLHRELDTTIIYVTHDQAQAMTMSDRIAVINSGELMQVDPPLKCYNEPDNLFVAGFIGSPAMNFVEGQITASGFESRYLDIPLDPETQGVEPGQNVTLGVRPEDVYLEAKSQQAGVPSDPQSVVADVLEPMGDEIFVYLLAERGIETSADEMGEGQLLMSVEPDADVREAQDNRVVLDRDKIHLFDSDTEQAIIHGLK